MNYNIWKKRGNVAKILASIIFCSLLIYCITFVDKPTEINAEVIVDEVNEQICEIDQEQEYEEEVEQIDLVEDILDANESFAIQLINKVIFNQGFYILSG